MRALCIYWMTDNLGWVASSSRAIRPSLAPHIHYKPYVPYIALTIQASQSLIHCLSRVKTGERSAPRDQRIIFLTLSTVCTVQYLHVYCLCISTIHTHTRARICMYITFNRHAILCQCRREKERERESRSQRQSSIRGAKRKLHRECIDSNRTHAREPRENLRDDIHVCYSLRQCLSLFHVDRAHENTQKAVIQWDWKRFATWVKFLLLVTMFHRYKVNPRAQLALASLRSGTLLSSFQRLTYFCIYIFLSSRTLDVPCCARSSTSIGLGWFYALSHLDAKSFSFLLRISLVPQRGPWNNWTPCHVPAWSLGQKKIAAPSVR